MKRMMALLAIVAMFMATAQAQISGSAGGPAASQGRTCETVEANAEIRELWPELGTEEDFEEWMEWKIADYEASPTEAVTTIPKPDSELM